MKMSFEGDNRMLPATTSKEERYAHDIQMTLELYLDNCTDEEVNAQVYAMYDALCENDPEIGAEIKYFCVSNISVESTYGTVIKTVLTIHFRKTKNAEKAHEMLKNMIL